MRNEGNEEIYGERKRLSHHQIWARIPKARSPKLILIVNEEQSHRKMRISELKKLRIAELGNSGFGRGGITGGGSDVPASVEPVESFAVPPGDGKMVPDV
jgi:hypothetical protein